MGRPLSVIPVVRVAPEIEQPEAALGRLLPLQPMHELFAAAFPDDPDPLTLHNLTRALA